jgi:hypothetical protein
MRTDLARMIPETWPAVAPYITTYRKCQNVLSEIQPAAAPNTILNLLRELLRTHEWFPHWLLATITRDDTSTTHSQRDTLPSRTKEIEAERPERTESNQEEGKGETEERERKMEQVGYEIDETPQPTNQPKYRRDHDVREMFADELRDNVADTGNGKCSTHPSIGNGRYARAGYRIGLSDGASDSTTSRLTPAVNKEYL